MAAEELALLLAWTDVGLLGIAARGELLETKRPSNS
jgi:hypothetical protein